MKFFKKAGLICFMVLLGGVLLSGCGEKEPVTVTLWHVYGGQTESPLNDMIEIFNETEGRKNNVQVVVGSVTNTNTIHENVLSSAFNDPGASELPNMFVSYPKTVLAMPDDTVLVDYRDYLTEDEINAFIPEFIEEGTIEGRLTILPVAKSTEIMFINKTAFDRFSKETGVKVSDLQTWEGLFKAAEIYVDWTDGKTPEIVGDGKPFFVHDYHFNYFQVGVDALGGQFFKENTVNFEDPFEQVWNPYARAALKGGIWLQGGYATEPLRTGDAIVSVASSASVLYYSNQVTYADNTSEIVEIIALPCPVFEKGKVEVMQRGAGICTVKSTPEKEAACMTFLRWLTDAERNVEFVTQVGYMPVKQASFETALPAAIENLEDPMYASLYQTFLKMQQSYDFYTPPQLDSYLDLETKFEDMVRQTLISGQQKSSSDASNNGERLEKTVLKDFISRYTR